jgi:peptidoglycan/LPS O-acetylase OafA/YrhL
MNPMELIPSPSPAGTQPAAGESLPSLPSGQRFGALDGLRGLAALGIVFIHYSSGVSWRLPIFARLERFYEMSPICLDIFLILSGFLIGGSLIRTRNAPDYYKTFYRRRCYRILPLYYAWIAIFFVFYFVGQGWGLWPPKDMSPAFYLASFLFFIQNFFTSIIESSFIVAPTWTLAVEEHFYLLAPLFVRRLSPRRLVHVLLGIIVLAPIFRGVLFRIIGQRENWAGIASRIWSPCRADALAMGVLLAVVWRSPNVRAWVDKHMSLCALGMVAGSGAAVLLSRMADANYRYCRTLSMAFGRTGVEFASLSVIVYLLWRPRSAVGRFFSTKVLRELGKISYCLYLIHWGILWMIYRFILHAKFGDHLLRLDIKVAPIALLLSIAIAKVSWHYLESPLIQRSHRQPQRVSISPMPQQHPQTA